MAERFGDAGHDYKRGDDGGAAVDEGKVNELLAARLHARLNRDFVAADRMRDQLRSELGVEVYDHEREWKCAEPSGVRDSRPPRAEDEGNAAERGHMRSERDGARDDEER